MMRRGLFLLGMISIVLSLAAAMPIAAAARPGDNGRPGNSGAARQCQKGGWASLARAESQDTAFLDQGECVSYAAQGGTLVPHVVLSPTISIGFRYHATYIGHETCWADVSLTNLDPDQTYMTRHYLSGFPVGNFEVVITPQLDGTAGYTPDFFPEDGLDVYLFDASGTQVSSASTVVACQAPAS